MRCRVFRTHHMAFTDTGLKTCTLVSVDTLKPLGAKRETRRGPGTVLMMSLCEVLHVYEFLPSRRKTELCHYYQRFYGADHPLLYEKNLVKRINQGTDRDIFTHGRVTLPGFSSLNCTLAPGKSPGH